MSDIKNGITGLMRAASQGDLSGLLEALSEGYDVNETDAFGHTALAYAVMAGHTHVVEALLLMGTKADTTNLVGMSPRMIAASRNDSHIERLLTGQPADEKQLSIARRADCGGFELLPGPGSHSVGQ